MAKLKLRVDDLAIESFPTAPETRRGTVVAAEYTVILWTECDADTFYDPACCSTHETACEGATCVVLSQCCPDQTGSSTCQASCACGPSAYCAHTDVC